MVALRAVGFSEDVSMHAVLHSKKSLTGSHSD